MYKKYSAAVFLFPALAVILFIMIYPLFMSISMSISSIDLGSFKIRFIGFDNYKKLFTEYQFWRAVLNSLIWMIGSTAGSFVLGFILAILLNRRIPGISIFRLLLLIPWTIPGVVIAYTWFWLYHPDFGIISWLIYELRGAVLNILTNETTALPSLIFVNIWWGYPFVMLMLLAGLQTVPSSHYEAAIIDGANSFQIIKYIIIPWLRPVAAIVLILETIRTLNGFTLIKIMTGGGPGGATDIFGMMIYRKGFMFFHFEEAAAASVVVLLISLAIALFYIRIIAGRKDSNA